MSTYTPIASITLGSAQSSVTFSNIPQTYTDLVLVSQVKSASANNIYIRLGNTTIDTGSNYSFTSMAGDGSSTWSDRYTNQTSIQLNYFATIGNHFNYISITQLQNYSNATTNKTVLVRHNQSAEGVGATVGLWRNTSAINTFTLIRNNVDFDTGSTFNLYGIANASITNTAKATGGDSVTTDGTYWYHTFRSSGTFTPTQALTADYLVVAGGAGGGGGAATGGGAAGGMRCTVTGTGGSGSLETALSLTAQAYTVTVGAGGSGGTDSSGTRGAAGSNSVFSTITATGGGGGGANNTSGNAGGSGGGGGGGGTPGTGGAASPSNQGFAGGNGTSTPNYGAGGGGGASAVGANGTGAASGNGGAGRATNISGSSVTYAGGGGGGASIQGATAGTGGAGGGGNGTATSTGTAGTANTGGGGGGSGANSGTGGSGGSGIVIIRYAV